MARQTGIIGIQGTVGGLVFSKNGNISQKPQGDKAAFANAPSRARTRENAAEFGLAAKYSKLLATRCAWPLPQPATANWRPASRK